jgi:phage host-nuclease inhibitor protein Gam
MNEFTRSLLYIALLICVPIVTACIQKGIAVAVDAINAQTQNIKVQRLVREIGDAVANAVAAMNQTYVNDLKAAGTFNEAEQKEALMRAVSAALKSMSSDAQDYIKSNFGDTTQYLENRIEAQIDANHVAAQNTLNLG